MASCSIQNYRRSESEGHAEIISNPRLMTANQQTADIEAGESIPYQQSAGKEDITTTAFKKAVLRLKVTPTISSNGKIILHLQVNQDKRSAVMVKGEPMIDTRSITTQVLVSNGQTVVLGGIYETVKQQQVQRIPFISSIPIIGYLFPTQKNHKQQTRTLDFRNTEDCEMTPITRKYL